MSETLKKRNLWNEVWKHRIYYLFLLPAAFILIYFNFVPTIATVLLSFKDFNPMDGIWLSPWVGFENFQWAFMMQDFYAVIANTLILSALRLVFGFFPPIILAILLYDIRIEWYRRLTQSITYLPHFLSWVIVYGFVFMLMSPATGLIPNIIRLFGITPPDFLIDPKWYRTMFIGWGIWKTVGWSAIIYLAALAGIEKELFEAAAIDGAGVWKRISRIMIPSILPIMVLLLTLNMGQLFSVGFEQTMLFSNSANILVADIIDSWVFRQGLVYSDFNTATAVGFLQNAIGIALIISANWLAKRLTGSGLY